MTKQRDGEKGRVTARASLLIILFSLTLFGCSRSDPEAERRAAVAAALAKLQSCAPPSAPDDEGDVKLAIASVTRQPNETLVRLAAYALDKPVEFDLPVYILSRGRWLIHETGRAYLLDEQCSEYKLKERRASSGRETPLDGHLKLEAGQVFEVTLVFPPLPKDVRMGELVYGRRVLPFLLSPETR